MPSKILDAELPTFWSVSVDNLAAIPRSSLLDKGLPSVAYLADQLHISRRYLTDLLKIETGRTTQYRK